MDECQSPPKTLTPIDDALADYENACAGLAKVFAQKYYDITPPDTDFHWIGGRVGGVLGICDEYWNMERMREALEYNATSDQLFDYYWAEVDAGMKDQRLKVSFKNYVLYNIPLEE